MMMRVTVIMVMMMAVIMIVVMVMVVVMVMTVVMSVRLIIMVMLMMFMLMMPVLMSVIMLVLVVMVMIVPVVVVMTVIMVMIPLLHLLRCSFLDTVDQDLYMGASNAILLGIHDLHLHTGYTCILKLVHELFHPFPIHSLSRSGRTLFRRKSNLKQ